VGGNEEGRLAGKKGDKDMKGATRVEADLSRYASMSSPLTTLRTLHRTIASISSQTLRSTRRRPVRPSRDGSAGMWAAVGANQSSSSFSGPSKG